MMAVTKQCVNWDGEAVRPGVVKGFEIWPKEFKGWALKGPGSNSIQF